MLRNKDRSKDKDIVLKHVIIRGISYIFDKKSLKSIIIPRRDKTSIENQNTLFEVFKLH